MAAELQKGDKPPGQEKKRLAGGDGQKTDGPKNVQEQVKDQREKMTTETCAENEEHGVRLR